jgi:hypothetical protein
VHNPFPDVFIYVLCSKGGNPLKEHVKIRQSELGENSPTLKDLHPLFHLRKRRQVLLLIENILLSSEYVILEDFNFTRGKLYPR